MTKKLITTSLVALGLATSINAGDLKYFAGYINCNHADYKPKKYAKATVFVFKGFTTDDYHKLSTGKDHEGGGLFHDMQTALNDIESNKIDDYCLDGRLMFIDFDSYSTSHFIGTYETKEKARVAFSKFLQQNQRSNLIKKRIKVKDWINLDKWNND
jgi:hypothetical protein